MAVGDWTSGVGRMVSTRTVNGVTYTVQTDTNDKRCTLVTVMARVTGTDTGNTATDAQKQAVHNAIVSAVDAKINAGF